MWLEKAFYRLAALVATLLAIGFGLLAAGVLIVQAGGWLKYAADQIPRHGGRNAETARQTRQRATARLVFSGPFGSADVTAYLPIAISILNLAVSVGSLSIAFHTARRTAQAEKPIWWPEIQATSKPDLYLVTLTVRNQSSFDLKPISVAVPIQEFRSQRSKTSFLLNTSPCG
jgi:hypothetical protein